MRRLCGVLAVLALAVLAPAAGASSGTAVNQSRALNAYAAMQRAYYHASAGLYGDTVGRWAAAWPYSQAMAATISVAAIPGLHRKYRSDLQARLGGLEAYADHADAQPAGYSSEVVPPRGPGGSRYNDDNEWIGIELIRLNHLATDPRLLTAAAKQLTLVYSQWDTQPVFCPGGVPWQTLTPGTTRNTVSNATGAELGAQLYASTHNAAYLNEALQMYNWVRTCLTNPDGLYGDHLDDAGDVDPTEWTYNQGTMIGAGVMLYQATHNRTYLLQARATALTALATFTPEALAQQPEAFDAIYVRNLLLLGAATGDPRYKSFASWFAGDQWSNVRDPVSGLFLSDPGGTTQLADQSAMVQVYALLASPPSTYF
jgi:uncharacterized protein YyaL (SSP411 family)